MEIRMIGIQRLKVTARHSRAHVFRCEHQVNSEASSTNASIFATVYREGKMCRMNVAMMFRLTAFLFAVFSAVPLLATQMPDRKEIGAAELASFEVAVADRQFDSAKRSEIVSEVFADASYESLDRLLLHENNSVALQAAWEAMVQALGGRCEIDDYREERRVQVHRFLGILVGRLRVEIPAHWTKTLETIEVQNNNIGWMEVPEHIFTWWGWMKPDLEVVRLRARLEPFEVAMVDEERRRYRISSKQTTKSFTFNMPVNPHFPDEAEMARIIAAAEDSSSLVVMIRLEDDRFNEFNYVLIDVSLNSEGEAVERYRAMLNSNVAERVFHRQNHLVEIVLNETRVFVFGSCNSDVWIDVIERKSGDVSARLTTAYAPFRAMRYKELMDDDGSSR